MDGWFEVRVAGFSREYGTLVNFKDGFHRKISTWTFFAAVSFHPRDVTFSTSVHSFSLNWSFNVIRIPVQLAVKLNTLLWNYPKKEETFHHEISANSKFYRSVFLSSFFIFFFLKDTWRRCRSRNLRKSIDDDICFLLRNEKYLDTLFHFIDFRLRVTASRTFSSAPAWTFIQLEITKRIYRPSWRIGNDCCFLPWDR